MYGEELWKSDGTEAGTVLVKDIVPGAVGSNPSALVAAGRLLLFSACDLEAGCELWASDGTEEGTKRLADVAPGALPSNPVPAFTEDLAHVFFSADDGANGRELWALPLGAILGCDDGLDNDRDGLRDFPDDLGCLLPNSLSEDPACQNGRDDDDDGQVDFDGGLSALGYVLGEPDDDCVGPAGGFERPMCGLGAELALLLAPWLLLRGRRRQNG